MKKWWMIIGVVIIIVIVLFFFLPQIVETIKQKGGPPIGQGGPNCSVEPGEWLPQKDECPGTTAEKQAQCNEFCSKHPDCCGDRNEENATFGGREQILPLPTDSEIAKLTRNYPAVIKALNEGPNIYPRSWTGEIIADAKLEEIKTIGFNTIQVLLIGKKENDQLIFNDFNNAILLNDIVAMKKHGLAVWVALDLAGGQPGNSTTIGNYQNFKASFLNFIRNSAELMEKYQVEYLTVNNEPDKPFKEQAGWSAADVNENLIDFFPATNAVAREKFKGKLINKITQTKKHSQKVLAASLENVDIAGVDVGPPMDGRMSLASYQKEFDEYQFFATLAQKAGLPWMNAEYWQGDFGEYGDFAKNNEVTYARVSFDAYLKATPKGAGYVWNDYATFSTPQGEEMKGTLKNFFTKF